MIDPDINDIDAMVQDNYKRIDELARRINQLALMLGVALEKLGVGTIQFDIHEADPLQEIFGKPDST